MTIHDLVFTGTQKNGSQKVEGQLYIAATGKSYRAVSGSTNLRPLPTGGYSAANLRLRNRNEMARPVIPSENNGGGMCFPAWSVDLSPLFSTQRTLLRIHPDGNLPGTEGCIGIIEEVHNCYADLKKALESKSELLLLVNHNNR